MRVAFEMGGAVIAPQLQVHIMQSSGCKPLATLSPVGNCTEPAPLCNSPKLVESS